MPGAIGYEAYVAYGGQTAFGTPVVPTITAAHLREGSVLSPETSVMPRISTTSIMPKPSQTWNAMQIIPFEYGFELNTNVSAWLPLFTAAWGKRVKSGAGPVVHTFTLNNPPVDPSTADDATNFYNRGLTLRQTFTNVATYGIQDACIDRFTLVMNRNDSIRFSVAGSGQLISEPAAVTYVDITGTTYAWDHAASSANGGIQAGSANPPTSGNQMVVKSIGITLNNGLIFEPQIGAAPGLELRLPTRGDYPSVEIAIEGWMDDITPTDAKSIMTDFIAKTKRNFRAKAYIDANNSIEFKATGATAPVAWDKPRWNFSGNGPIGFSVTGRCYQEAAGDVAMVFTTLT